MKTLRLALSAIEIPADRIRKVKPDMVALQARQIAEGDLLPPIQVRHTPNGAKKYVLVSGEHRLEAAKAAGATEIDAISLGQISAADARKQEVRENLFRNELTALEKIAAVAEYRRIFEAEFGKVSPGGNTFVSDPKESLRQVGAMVGSKTPANLAEVLSEQSETNLLGLVEDSEDGRYFQRVADRLGLSRRMAQRFATIASRLTPALKEALIGSSAEDNLSAIERLSKLPPEDQAALAVHLTANEGDLAAAEEAMAPTAPPLTPEQRRYEVIVDGWTRASEAARRRFLVDYRPEIERLLRELDRR